MKPEDVVLIIIPLAPWIIVAAFVLFGKRG